MNSTVKNLCDSLESVFTSSDKVDPGLIYKAMDASDIQPSHLEDYAFFDKDVCYTRNLVHETPHFTLLCLCWAPNSTTAIHTHNNSQCWARVVLNQMNEVVYDGMETRNITKNTIAKETSVLYIDDSLGVHRLANESKMPSITLHCYAPKIHECEFYCIKSGLSGKTKMSCFSEYGKIVKKDPCFVQWKSCCSFENKV